MLSNERHEKFLKDGLKTTTTTKFMGIRDRGIREIEAELLPTQLQSHTVWLKSIVITQVFNIHIYNFVRFWSTKTP